jgi:hypothetical protein
MTSSTVFFSIFSSNTQHVRHITHTSQVLYFLHLTVTLFGWSTSCDVSKLRLLTLLFFSFVRFNCPQQYADYKYFSTVDAHVSKLYYRQVQDPGDVGRDH